MPVTVTPLRTLSRPVANCGALGQMIADVQARKTMVMADDQVADLHSRQVHEALAAQHGARVKAIAAMEKALAASDADIVRHARKATISSADLFLVLAVQTRNPALIASAAGIDILVDEIDFAVQLIQSDTGVQQAQAVATLFKARGTLISTLASGPGKDFSGKIVKLGSTIAWAMYRLGEAAIDANRLRGDLRDARDALAAIETSIAGLPPNLAAWKSFMIAQLDAQIDLYTLLQSDYADRGCRIDGLNDLG